MGRIIVDVLPPQGETTETRHVFDQAKVTLGRSYQNDVILDDPFISPKHLIVVIENGQFKLKDLASKNGTQVNNEAPVHDKVFSADSGAIITLGKTRIKLMTPDHPVAPARPLDNLAGIREFIDRPWVPLLFSLGVIGFGVLVTFSSQPSPKFWDTELYTMIIGFSAGILSYAGILSLYTFYRYKRSYFIRNIVVSCTGLFISQVYEELQPFIYFWILNDGLVGILDLILNFAILYSILWAGVRLTKDAMSHREVANLAWIPLVLILIGAVGKNLGDLDFSNQPSFHSYLAPGMKPIQEPLSVPEFLESGAEIFDTLKEE